MPDNAMLVRNLGLSDYLETWEAMRRFTDSRDSRSPDELWLTEHPAVFTQGLNGRAEHLLAPGGIPVVQTDRGGQVTYHGPGQLVLYCLLDILRLGLGVRGLVARIEGSVLGLLDGYGIEGHLIDGAPGVYVREAKLAALGLRIRKGCCYHGLSLNVDPDLEPFGRINPCGYQGLEVTSLRNLGVEDDLDSVGERLGNLLMDGLREKEPGRAGR